MKHCFSELMRSRKGNFAITTAFLLPLMLMGIGVAVDISSMVQSQTKLQNAADSAALAATSAMVNNGISAVNAKKLAEDMLKAQMRGAGEARELLNPTISVTETALSSHANIYRAEVKASFNVPLSGFQVLFGYNTARISVMGSSESEIETKNPISMYLVLDRSGSMQWVTTVVDTARTSCDNYYEANWPRATWQSPCYVKKIDSLKTAVSTLADQLDTNDPDNEYVRLGAVSYNTAAQTPQALTWGTTSARTYVNALTATGGTNSAPGMQIAYQSLNAASENQAHLNKNGGTPSKFIVLMTDGSNDNANNDASTLTWCTSAKTAGMTVYTVAFVAPARGKTLLASCSSGPEYAFEASNVPQLIAAFQAIGQKTTKLTNRLTR